MILNENGKKLYLQINNIGIENIGIEHIITKIKE